MYITHCTTVNNLIREMAAELKLGVSYTCNLVSVWQSRNNSTKYPSIDELKSLITEQERFNNEIGLAIPEYTMEKFDPNKPLARTSKDNKIILMELPEENPIGYFFDYINGGKNNTSDQKKKVFEKLKNEGFKQEELRELITTPLEAYNFLSWHEMSHVQYNDREVYCNNGKDLTTPDKIAIEARATKDAWLKARVYRHKHSIDKQPSFAQTAEFYSEDGKTPITMYRGYAMKENKEASTLEETIGHTAVDYDDTLKGAIYFTSSEEEAEDYAKGRTDKSPEPPTQENPQGRPINRHYTGDYAKVSKYHIAANAKVEHYANMKDYVRNGKNSTADVIVLDKGTLWADNTEYIVRNPSVVIQQIQQQPQQNSFNIFKAEFYSGAANGSDKEWGSQARALGIKVKDYTVQDWDALPQEWKDKLEKEYQEVVKVIGRTVMDKTSYSGKLVRRDMMQADKADAIFAVSTISPEGIVNGGTAYAATRGILKGIPVYVFDQSDNQWKVWDKNSKSFILTSEPTLTSHAATIGTREINDAGKQAIKSILTKTVNQQTTQQDEIQNISSKTAAYGVVIDPNLKDSYVQWQRGIPKGIVAYRVNYNKYNTPEEALAGRIGNPFSENTRDKDTVQQFYDWLVTGNNFGNNKATEEYRQAIINKIMNTPNGSPILYYKELGRPSHATVLGYLISNKQLLQQSTQQNNLPGPETKINIYAGTNENADLSNFAKRPFKAVSPLTGEEVTYNTVEGAFQAAKLGYTDLSAQEMADIETSLMTATGVQAKSIGRSIKGLDVKRWNGNSSWEMKNLIKASFQQNPQALQRLLATGNATLTHTQDKGKWGTEFPKLLMEVRDELRGETPQIENNKSTLTTKQALDRANGFIGEVNESPYSKQGNRFVLKSGTPVLNALKVVMDRGHKPEKSIFGDVYDGQVSYNLGYSSGSKAVMAVTNRDLFDEGWEATDILLMRESERYGQPLESQTTTNIEGEKQATFLVNENDKILIDYLENKGYKYELYTSAQQQSIPASYEGKVNNNMNNNTNVNDVTKVPEIGTEVIDTNKENPRTKLAKDYNSVTRHDRVIMLARMFSKKVDAIVKEKSKEVAREMADELSKSNPSRDEIMRINARAMLFNDGIKGRRAAMEDATIKKIFESMREDIEEMASTSVEDFEEEYGEGTGEHMVAEYNKILDNWYALLDEACIYIEKAENVRVTVEEAKEDNKEVQGKTSDSTQDEDTNDAANNDDEDGERAEGNGGWSFKVRFVDPRTSLSKDVKKILNSIVRFNSNGEIDVDDLGNTRYLDSEVAHAALINHLSNMIDADDFCVKDENGNYTLPALQKVAVRYPWVNQVINALKHNPSAISAFYADFRKDFIPYWTQIFDKEKQVWKTVALNSPVALDSVMSEVTQNYEHGDTLEEDSLYTKSGKVNPKAASTGLEEVNNALSDIRDYDSEDDTEMVDTIVKNLRRIGFNTNKTVIGNLLNTENGVNDVESVLHRVKRIYQESVNLDADAHLISSLNDDYSEIAKIIGLVSELNNVQSFREGDKTYYSYSAPNYIDTLVKTIKNDARRNSYIEKEFGFTEWFRNSDGEWMSEWVNLLLNDEDVRFQFDTKELLSIDGKQYTDWEPWRIKKAFILEYFSLGTNKGSNKQYAWYNIPILSDSPVAKFIKFKRYTGKFVEQLLPLFRKVVEQELWRIQLVQDRAAVGASPIGNFDVVGTKFHFFPELNANNNEFLKNVTELKKICKKTGDASAMNDYIDRTILSIMNANFEAFLKTNLSDENKNEIANTLIADGTIKNADGLNAALEEYFWNQAYATTQIIELTTTDLAFYKDGTDFQKRYKEVYAAGTKLNTNSPYGRKVERTIYLTDDEITSNSYLDIKKSLDDAVKLGHITASERDNILSKFKEVNVADAQAYRSISSMRAVLDMMGAWDDNMQKSYDRIKEGKWEPQDFNIVWQTIKPFVFTQIQKPDGLGGTMKVPHQNKNSEFLLLALHNVIASSLSKSPKLRAINRFMEKHNIDVIQFESAVKAGKQGRVNINYSKDKLNTWAGQNVAAYNEIESAVTSLGKDLSKMSMYEIFKLGNDTLLDQNKLSQEEYNNRFDSIQPDEEEVYKTLEKCALQENGEYNPTVVHELPYSDYSIQQPTPEHLFDVKAVFGSQFRNLILSDIPEDAIIKVNGKDMTKKEVVYLYHSIVVENLLEDYKKVAGKFSSIESLQKALLDSVKGNPKYGRDMLDALQLVEITDPRDSNKTIKVFNIPLDNPNTTTKIQELVTSMFKNAVTKQHIKGGACILVSSYGHSDPPQVLHNEDGSIKGIECYLPAYSKQFYAPFMVTKHTEEGKEYQELDINKMPLELRRLVGYRIPTEDKYSMAPLIVKGFLPQQNGSAIMLPADITQIAGSDYDVDKLFLMIPEFRLVNKYNIKDAWRDFYASHPDISKQVDNAKWEAFRRYYERVLEEQPEIAEEIDVEDKDFRDWFIKESGLKTYDLVDNIKDEFAKWFDVNKNNYITGTEVAKINYNTNKSPQEQSRQARNNMLIDISYGILTHKDTAEKIHNPGNFDKVKIAARIANIISNTNLMYQFAEANNIPIYKLSDEEVREAVCDLILKISSEGNLGVLDKFMKDHSIVRSQLTVDTFIYNHKQNMTGGKLIGIYANNTTMQAKYQASNLAIKENYTFTINGRVISSLHDITAANGERISKNCANFSAASVDNVKDPVLADLMQNTNTAYIAGFMLRAGMSIEEIGLLFSQPAIRAMIKSDGTLDGIDDVIDRLMNRLANYGGSVDGNIRMHNFTSKELLMNCLNNSLIYNSNIDNEKKGEMLIKQIEAVLLIRHIMYIAEELNNLTSISRADSPNGAISTSIAGSKLQRRKVEIYNRRSTMDIFPIAGVSDASRNNYVSVDTDIDTMREKLLSRKMPMLQTFYSLGIDLSGQILSKYFSQTSAYSDALVDTLCDNADGGAIKEKMLNNMYSELVEFALSKTKLFGDDGTSTFDEKRNYYLNEFYKTYIRVLAENPDIAALNIFKKMTVDENNTIVMLKSGRITPSMKESLMRDFDTLLDSDNPAAQKLAIDLFMYAYYKEGFKFGPNSFGNFFSSNFISSFPEFINTLRTMKYDIQKGSYFDRFLPQFYANHLNESGLVPGIKGKKKGDIIQANGMVSVKASLVLNENIAPLGVYKSYPYIRIGRSIFALQQEGKDRVIYVPALVFGGEQKRGRVIYNANKKVEEMSLMSAINSAEEETSPNKVDTPLTGLENSNPYSTEEGQGELKEPLC